ncbi:MAG: TonB-dependent receptor [Gemmatimonadota bacterium]|nr:TonB-dependent receptor [Gemmatimonadota bacterium]
MNSVMVRAAAFAALFVTCATSGGAIPTGGFLAGPSVVGVVRDSAGALLPNVQIVVAEAGRSATTDAAGRFEIRGLARGEYHLTTLLIGYRPGHAIVTVPDAGPDINISIVMAASPLRLQAVSVTASPTGADPERVAQATVEVSGLALQRAMASNIAQTLGQEPGVSVRFDGPATMPVIRGLTGDRILVLQDGARTADLSSASADHASTVDPLSASRIEVVRGPASLLYGNNALGGVVNVISNDIPTSVPTHLEGYFGAIGSTGAPGGATTLSLTNRLSDAWALNLRGGLQSASSIRVGGGNALNNTQSRNLTGNAGLGYVGQRATVGGSVSNYSFNYGLPHPPGDDEVIHIAGNRFSAAFRATVNTRSRAIPLVKVDAGAQDYHHDELSAAGAVGTEFKLKTQTLNASAKTQLGRTRGSVGAQLLGKQYAATGDEALTPAANSTGFGAFFYQELPLRGDGASELVPTLSFGGRFDMYEIASKAGDQKFGAARSVDVSSPSGSIGLSIPLGAVATLSGNAALAFRAPTVEELFSNGVHEASGSYDLGNPSLRAEQSRGVEAVLRVGTGTVSGSASAYVNSISNYVFPDVRRDTTVDSEEMPLAIYAQGDARLHGFEGSVEIRATTQIVLGAMGDYVKGSFSDDGMALPFMPPARVGGSARWDDGRRNIGVELRHGFEQDRITGGADIRTAGYTLLNASAGMNVVAGGRVHSVTLRVDNLGDTKYFDATSRIKEFAPSPGRNVALVYKVLF